jgi:hypothetical protein
MNIMRLNWRFKGKVVYGTVHPHVIRDQNNHHVQTGFSCTFKIDCEPDPVGEYVMERGGVKVFADYNAAVCGIFAAAEERIWNPPLCP